MVVFHHFAQFGVINHIQPSSINFFSAFFTHYGAMGVDLFFVISGFMMYKTTNEKSTTPGLFILHRLIRIMPAYWFFTCLTGVLLVTFTKLIPLTEFGPIFLIKSLLFIPAQNPSGIGLYPLLNVGWTLNYEMAFYLVFAAALFLRPSYRLAGICFGIFIMQAVVPKLGSDFGFYANKISFEFLMGIAIGIIHRKNILRISVIPAIIITTICFAFISGASNVHAPFHVGFPFAVCIAIAVSQEKYFKSHAWLTKLGDWSYSTYLSHILVLSMGYRLVQIENYNHNFILPVCCGLILLISWASYRFLEQGASRQIKRALGSRGGLPIPDTHR